MFLQGLESGDRGIIVTPSDPTESLSVTIALDADAESFSPGEPVTLTLTAGILSLAGVDADGNPTAPLPLRAVVLDHFVQNGDLQQSGTFQTPVVVEEFGGLPFTDVRGTIGADLLTQYSGNELAVVDANRGLVLLYRQGNSWLLAAEVALSGLPVGIAIGDVDRDGRVELCVPSTNGVIEFFQVSSGTLQALPEFETTVNGTIQDFGLADLNGDGLQDIAVATSGGLFALSADRQVQTDPNEILLGNLFFFAGFVEAQLTARDTYSVKVADMYLNGRPGLIVADDLGVAFHLNNLSGLLPVVPGDFPRTSELLEAPSGPGIEMAICEIGADDRRVVVFSGDTGLLYYTALSTEFEEEDGSLSFSAVPEWTSATFPLAGGAPDSFGFAELDGDAAADLVTYHAATGLLTRYASVPGTVFELEQQLVAPALLGEVGFGFYDLNGDSGRDIVLTAGSGAAAGVFAAQTLNVLAPPMNSFSFQVPEEVTYSLGSGEVAVPVTANLSDQISGFTVRLTYDEAELELLRFELDPALPSAAETTLIERGTGLYTVSETLSGTGQVVLANAIFALVSEDFGSFGYQLANGTDGLNQVVTPDNVSFPVGLDSAAGTIEVESSVPSLTNVVCESMTDYTFQQDFWVPSHAITVTWDVPNGTQYDDIRVVLDGFLQTTIVGNSATFLSVNDGAHSIEVTGFINGVQSSPTTCTMFIVAPPVQGPVGNPVFTASRTTCAGLDCVLLQWDNGGNLYDWIEIYRDGSTTPIPAAAMLSGFAQQFSDLLAENFFDAHTYQLVAVEQVIEDGVLVTYRSNPISTVLAADPTMSSIDAPTAINATIVDGDVQLSWVNLEFYAGGIEVTRDGTSLTTLAGDATSFTDSGLPVGVYNYNLLFSDGVNSPVGVSTGNVTIPLLAPTALSCTPQLTAPPVVDLAWTNATSYDTIVVERLEVSTAGSDWEAIEESLAGGATSYTDTTVVEGQSYEYRVAGVLNAVISDPSTSCTAILKHSVRVADIQTTLGRTNERIEIYGNLFGDVSAFTLTLSFPPGALDFGTNPSVSLPSGGTLLNPPTIGSSTITLDVDGLISAGVERLLAVIVVDLTADSNPATAFTVAGDRPLTLSNVSFNGMAVDETTSGTMSISDSAQFIEVPPLLPAVGETFNVPIYGTFGQTIQSAVVLMEFDPTIVQAESVEIDSSVFTDLSLQFFDNGLGLVSAPLIPAFGNSVFNIPASIRLPLLSVQFRVLAGAAAGADTGITLVDGSNYPSYQPPAYTITIQNGGTPTTTTVLPDLLSDTILVGSGTGPIVTAVVPAEGSIYGNTVQLFGSNLANPGLAVFLGGTELAVVTSEPDELLVQIPALANTATLPLTESLSVSHGGGSSTFDQAYTHRPSTLSSVSPTMGIPGQVITVSGTFFPTDVADIDELWFGDVQLLPTAQPALVVVGQSATHLDLVAPVNAAGAATIRITFAGQGEQQISGFEYLGAPSNLSLSATTGPLRGGNSVTISGDNLLAGSTVDFDGTTIPLDATLQFTVPAYSGPLTQDVAVSVTATSPAGVSTEVLQYTYQVLALSSVAPAQGAPTGGTPVAINGAGLAATGTTVSFGASSAVVVSASNDGATLNVLAPAGSGLVDVTVNLDDGQAQTLLGAFQYDSIMVTGATPAVGSICGGDQVTVTGMGLADVTSVTFDGVAGTAIVVDPSGTSLTVTTPAGSAGTVDIVVATPTSAETLAAAFTYEQPTFIRGDVDGSGTVNTADLVILANYILAAGTAPVQLDAADVNDDGAIHVGDVTFLSQFLDPSMPVTMPAPFPSPGVDPTADPIPDC
ncbi:MAG: IPT/TIG domain-containing protein [Planctomycetota bacterium]